MYRRAAIILVLLLIGGGCASNAKPPMVQVLGPGRPAPAPPSDAKSLLTESQIQPPAVLPAPRPATRPDEPPPVEALALYASARDALLDGKAFAAADVLQRAIALDPDSFELYRALGEARLSSAHKPNPDELDAFEKALELRPGDLRLQALVGAQYASLGENQKALNHLRLATRSEAYGEDDVAAAAVDLLLARLFQEQGYDRAALDQYLILLHRLANPSYDLRSDPELGALAADPQTLWLEVGLLYEKHGQWAAALAVYEPLARDDPSSFDLQAKVVRMLCNTGQTPAALSAAAAVISRFRASSDSMGLLNEVCRARKLDAVAALGVLLHEHPGDSDVILALAQVLSERGRTSEAESLLESDGGADRLIVSTLFDLYLRRDDVPDATRVLIVYLAAHPDSLGEIQSWWDQLLLPTRANPLRVATLQNLAVDNSAGAAKLYLVWRLADVWRRDALARSALEQAVQIRPPFPPAFRQLAVANWAREDWSGVQKQKASDDLAARAEKGGNAELAAEVRGLTALSDQRPAEAIAFFEKALTLGGSSPQLLLTYAAALRAGKQEVKAEQLLLQLVDRQPQYDQAWAALFQFYVRQKDVDQSRKVLSQWLAASPASISARIIQADLAMEDGNPAESEAILLRLFGDHDDDPDVITALVGLGRRTGRLDQFLSRLEEISLREPANSAVVEWLVEIYVDEGRITDATRVLNQTRKAVAKDADLLYRMAHLYERVDQAATTEDVLKQVVALDPHHASACNDLGYTWADQGKNLDRAEAMIRVAVAEEPDNQSFLDSLGWVLYKEGQFPQAEKYFRLAVGPAAAPDPVVLDHYGDALYRAGKAMDAYRQWQRALNGLDAEPSDRADLRDLRLTLTRKLLQQSQGRAVGVAPVAGEK